MKAMDRQSTVQETRRTRLLDQDAKWASAARRYRLKMKEQGNPSTIYSWEEVTLVEERMSKFGVDLKEMMSTFFERVAMSQTFGSTLPRAYRMYKQGKKKGTEEESWKAQETRERLTTIPLLHATRSEATD